MCCYELCSEEKCLDEIRKVLDGHGIFNTEDYYGIRFSTGIDKWILGVDSFDGENVTYVLFHKSTYKHTHYRRGCPQEYHIQFCTSDNIETIVQYCIRHKNKWACGKKNQPAERRAMR